jgi:hypothetical protein
MAVRIGRGLTGVVNYNRHSDTVVKITNAASVIREQAAAKILSIIDPRQRYTLYGNSFTETTVRMPYGGQTPIPVFDAVWILQHSKDNALVKYAINSISTFNLRSLKASLDELVAWMPTLHAAGIAHSDITAHNMVWDGTSLRLIDWEQAVFEGSSTFMSMKRDDIMELLEYQKQLAFLIENQQKGGSRRATRRKRQRRRSSRTLQY